MMHPKVKQVLEQNKIAYRILRHLDFGEIKTAQDFSQKSGIPFKQVAKSLCVIDKTNHTYGMAILGASQRANFSAISTLLDLGSVSMAPLDELTLITGYEKFGTTSIATNLPTVIDEQLMTKDLIYVATGTVGEELEINPKDLQNVTQARTGKIT